MIRWKDTAITLIGTAHVSQKSVALVEDMIRTGNYDCIAVELCKPRHENLVNQAWWKNMDIFQVFRQKKAGLLLINLVLTAYQKRLAEKIGVEAGMEMQRAIELARENRIRLELIDRNIATTLHRLVHRVTFWQKTKLLSGLVASIFVGDEIDEKQIEELKKGDMLHSVMDEFGVALPEVKEALIDERDQYMTGKLAQLAETPDAPKNIIALVGAGHLLGMVPAFASPCDQNRLDELDRKPPPSKTPELIGWGTCLLVLAMFVIGYRQSPETGLQMLTTWAVITGGLSALGAAVGLAHPLSILSAFLAAPITTLNPALSAGMVVGLVEAFLRKPTVGDFENLRTDVGHWNMWWKNRVVRVFLIFFLANTGAAIGVWVAGASIVRQLIS